MTIAKLSDGGSSPLCRRPKIWVNDRLGTWEGLL